MICIALVVVFVIAMVPMSPLLVVASLYVMEDGNVTVSKCFSLCTLQFLSAM